MSVVIRLALPEDAPAIAAIYAPFCTDTPVSFEMVAPSADEMAQRIGKITERLPWLVLEQEGQIAGYVYASSHRERAAYQWSVDVTAYIDPVHRRKGVGRALYTTLFHILVQQGYFKAYAGVTLPNPASVGFMKQWNLSQWASLEVWATSWVSGTMWPGMRCLCSLNALNRNHLAQFKRY